MPVNDSKLKKRENVTWKKLGEEKSVLLDLNTGNYFTLNETATFVWELVLEEKSLEEIVDRVSETYDTGSADVKDDISGVLQVLLDKGLLSGAESQ